MKLGQRLSEEQIQEMRRLALAGKSALQISKVVGTSPTTCLLYTSDAADEL